MPSARPLVGPSKPCQVGCWRASAALLAAAALLSVAREARAEGWMVDASAALGTGLEGADPGGGDLSWQRARTRIIAGFDLRSDEAENESLGFRVFAELEQRGGVGAEVRYTRWLGRGFGGFLFGTGIIAPETLVGAGVGGTLILPLGPRFGVFVEPSFSALPLGSDVPDGSVLLWASLSLGIRLGL